MSAGERRRERPWTARACSSPGQPCCCCRFRANGAVAGPQPSRMATAFLLPGASSSPPCAAAACPSMAWRAARLHLALESECGGPPRPDSLVVSACWEKGEKEFHTGRARRARGGERRCGHRRQGWLCMERIAAMHGCTVAGHAALSPLDKGPLSGASRGDQKGAPGFSLSPHFTANPLPPSVCPSSVSASRLVLTSRFSPHCFRTHSQQWLCGTTPSSRTSSLDAWVGIRSLQQRRRWSLPP